MLVRRYSCPRSDFKLILEGPRPGGITNQIAAKHARDAFVRFPLILIGGVGLRVAGTRKVAEKEQHHERQSYYCDWFFFHRRDAPRSQRRLQIRQRPILLENVNRPATGHTSWNNLTQVVRIRFWIEKPGAKEGDELTKLVSQQGDWCREGGINTS